MRRAAVVLVSLCSIAVAACGGGAGDQAVTVEPRGQAADAPSKPTSIVQLGDSIASGEGTLYGYTYDAEEQDWTGGNVNAPWPPPYPGCHVSPDAYGNAVARYFGAAFHQFACSGATFANGITTGQVSEGAQLRPAQFGNWTAKTELNAEYDAAKPDLVLVTLGADDLQFSPIVEHCIKNGYEYYFDLANLECISDNPGSTIQQDYLNELPNVLDDYGTIVSWIEARAKANDVPVPKIVFTNYANPLPPNGDQCPDTSWLYPKQTEYLSSLVGQLDQKILSAIKALDNPNVSVADLSTAYTPAGVSHTWCSDDPWAYGLSIYSMSDPSSFDSDAPFHPTPEGQQSLAEHVIPVVTQLFDAPLPSVTTSTAPAPTTSSSAPATTTTSDGPTTSTGPATTTSGPDD